VEQINRFENLCKNKSEEIVMNNDKWLVNLSNTDIPSDIKNLLAFGEKFALNISLNKNNIIDLILNLESCTDDKRLNIDKPSIKNNIVNVLTNELSKPKPNIFKKEETTINKLIRKSRTFIKNNPQIIIARSDKGNTTVIANRNDYNEKLNKLLSDKTTYEVVKKRYRLGKEIDDTVTTQGKFNTFITLLCHKKVIDDKKAKELRRYNSQPAKLYGLFKIHKINNPIRPIVAYCGSPGEALANFYNEILIPITGKTSSYIKNSIDLKNKLKNIIVPKDHHIISLDVVSLYTNIPKNLLFKVIEQKWEEIYKNAKMPIESFKEGLSLIFDNCLFTFNKVMYKQNYGLPMGCQLKLILDKILF